MDLLIVERHANLSHWNKVAETLRQPVHVLVQQASESIDELYARAQSKLVRPGAPLLRRLVVLHAEGAREIAHAAANDVLACLTSSDEQARSLRSLDRSASCCLDFPSAEAHSFCLSRSQYQGEKS
jgi:hypothetical protein